MNTPSDPDSELQLHEAVRKQNVDAVITLINQGIDVNAQDSRGLTALHLAVRKYSSAYDNNRKNVKDNREVLISYMIEILLNSGAYVNIQDLEGKTPLHYLVGSATANLVELFLTFNADVNLQDRQGNIALYNAVLSLNVEIVKLLVAYGSKVNAKQGSSLLHVACTFYELEIIKCLIRNGADVDACNSDRRTPLMTLFRTHVFPSADITEYLLKYSDVNLTDLHGNNILHFCTDDLSYKIVLMHIAKLQALGIPLNSSIFDTISHNTYKIYLENCKEELEAAKNAKLGNTCISYFNLLVDNQTKLKNYAGNKDLVKEFVQSDCLNKFPIYGVTMQNKLAKGFKRYELFDQAAEILSKFLPVFSSSHLTIKDILDCIQTQDLSKFFE